MKEPLEIEMPWKSNSAKVGVVLSAVLLGILLLIFIRMFTGSGWNIQMIIATVFVVLCLVLNIVAARAYIINTVKVTVTNEVITIIRAPFPWIKTQTVNAAEIDQLYTHKTLPVRAFTLDTKGRYKIVARLWNGKWIKFADGFRSEGEAKQLERKIENHLDLINEGGDANTRDRSELFDQWRDNIQPCSLVQVNRVGNQTQIVIRSSHLRQCFELIVTLGFAGLLIYAGYSKPGMQDMFLIGCLAFLIISVPLVFIRKTKISIDGASLSVRKIPPSPFSSTLTIDPFMIHRLDCRSKVIEPSGSSIFDRPKRLYRIVAINSECDDLSLIDQLRSRNTAFAVLDALEEAISEG